MLTLNIDEIKFEFAIEGYHPSSRENWDDEWCNVIARANSRDLKYNINSNCMLCCEVEWLYDKLVELSNGTMKDDEEISFIEPDFEYKLFPNRSAHYYMEWKFNLWNEGVLTCNSITIMFDDDDIRELVKYLSNVIKCEVELD